jgi:hypothetical protein
MRVSPVIRQLLASINVRLNSLHGTSLNIQHVKTDIVISHTLCFCSFTSLHCSSGAVCYE